MTVPRTQLTATIVNDGKRPDAVVLQLETTLGMVVAEILVARHLKTTEDLFDNRGSPRTEAMVAPAVQWAEKIMRKIDNLFPGTSETSTKKSGIAARESRASEDV